MSYRQLPDQLLTKAKSEINEDPSRIAEDLKHIKEWIKKQSHLTVRDDDQWLLAFLRGCKFSLERTKEKLDTYHTMKTLVTDFYENRNVNNSDICKTVQQGILLPLFCVSSVDLPRYILLRIGSYDPDAFPFVLVMKVNLMLIEIGLMEDDYGPVNGIEVILDMEGLTMAHMPSPTVLKRAVICLQEAYPHRIKAIHFMNTPSFFEHFYGMVKPFLSEKIRNRVQIHGTDLTSLQNATSTKVLPKEYGGSGDSVPSVIDSCLKKLKEYEQWFLDDAKYGSDESKRTGKPKTEADMFGIEGSFRKLNVD